MVNKAEREADKLGTYVFENATRKNIPTAEMQPLASSYERKEPAEPAVYKRTFPLNNNEKRTRNEDLDPQLLWNGKDSKDWDDLVVDTPQIHVHDKVHPLAIIKNLQKMSTTVEDSNQIPTLFEDFNGLPSSVKTEFYEHDQRWQNRMILGDSLHVMASLATREKLQSQVQCIYFDPPYGMKFQSNWQVSTESRTVVDGKREHKSRQPEQIKAFRDTWTGGVHGYLTYLRDRLTVMRDLLSQTGSIFVQIGDENVHRVRVLMDEVFREENFISLISVQTTTGFQTNYLSNMSDFIIWYARHKPECQINTPFYKKNFRIGEGNARWLMLNDFSCRGVSAAEKRLEQPIPRGAKLYAPDSILSPGRSEGRQPVRFQGKTYDTWGKNAQWKAHYPVGMDRLAKAGRIHVAKNSIRYIRYSSDVNVAKHGNIWTDTGTGNFTDDKIYVVQTNRKIVRRCIQMATNPGDLVLDPTCGSGTTAVVAEELGRRWITIDTSRVSIAISRSRLIGQRYPYYYLADSPEGRKKEGELSGVSMVDIPTSNDLRQGFVYERQQHITLGSIANNSEIDVIWENWHEVLEPIRKEINARLKVDWQEWEIPNQVNGSWPTTVKELHSKWWKARVERQEEIDSSIFRKAEYRHLTDSPYEDKSKVRVTGPFTVESLYPHRVVSDSSAANSTEPDRHKIDNSEEFEKTILRNLQLSGVQQLQKDRRISFTHVVGWPGTYVSAKGTFDQDGISKKAAIMIGPEYGSVTRSDIESSAQEAEKGNFDVLVVCGFNFDPYASEVKKIGSLQILKAKMNPDLQMADDLKNTKTGNLFVVFGEPDIDWRFDDNGEIVVEILGVDVFDPYSSEIRSSEKDEIATWFIDVNYSRESFFVHHAYFFGKHDYFKQLKTALKSEINREAWETLYRDKSVPFPRPSTGYFAVKVINHFGDEVVKVFEV